MTQQHIHIGVEDSEKAFGRFIDAWHKAEASDVGPPEVRLNFEDLSGLLSVLTPTSLILLRTLRQSGPSSVRALAKKLERDYKNVHTNVVSLERVGLITRKEKGLISAPWDVIDAHLRLVA